MKFNLFKITTQVLAKSQIEIDNQCDRICDLINWIVDRSHERLELCIIT
jgi:hypothetical protein